MLHPITKEEIHLTTEQLSCINYEGEKRKNLVVRSAAGGGKSLVLVRRAYKYLSDARTTHQKNAIALFTYNHVLANYLKEWLQISPEDENYIFVGTLHEYLGKLYDDLPGLKLGNKAYESFTDKMISEVLEEYARKIKNNKYRDWGAEFWKEEFRWMRSMNMFNQTDRETYQSLVREGRGHEHPMDREDRKHAFEMFCMYGSKLRKKNLYDGNPTGDERILYLTHNSSLIPESVRFDYVLIDEAQDQSLAKMIALRMLVRMEVTICMDANQRIYEGRWRFKQVELNPTTKTLTQPFRCTSQIDALAESLIRNNNPVLLEEEQVEHVAPTRSGELPYVVSCKDEEQEKSFFIALVNKWMKEDPNHTIGVMCYQNYSIKKVAGWLSQEHIPFQFISNDSDNHYSVKEPGVKLCTFHSAKGLEFMRVILPKFYQNEIPQKWAKNDEELLVQQRNVAYVGMTRAMHQLVITYNGNKSQFIDEMDPQLFHFCTYEEITETEKKKTQTTPKKRTVKWSF